MNIGIRIKNIRKKRKMTLDDLAKQTDLTKSLISQIENQKANPSLKTLYAIASGLGVPVVSLFEENKQEDSPVIKKNKREELTSPIPGIVYQRLLPSNRPKETEFLYTIYTKDSSTGALRTHKGIEFGVVIRGSLRIIYDGLEYILNEGDSIYIECSKPHSLTNNTANDTEVIWVELPFSKGKNE